MNATICGCCGGCGHHITTRTPSDGEDVGRDETCGLCDGYGDVVITHLSEIDTTHLEGPLGSWGGMEL